MPVDGPQVSSAGSQRHLQMEPVVQLVNVAEGLLAKMYRLNSVLDYPDPNTHMFLDAFWKAGVLPNFPKICTTLSKKFPEHPSKLQLEKVDKFALEALNENAEGYMHNLEQWITIPRKMILQTYNILHVMLKGGHDCEIYHRLVQFVDSYDPPIKGLHEGLNFVSPRIDEVLEAVGPIIFLSTDTKKL